MSSVPSQVLVKEVKYDTIAPAADRVDFRNEADAAANNLAQLS